MTQFCDTVVVCEGLWMPMARFSWNDTDLENSHEDPDLRVIWVLVFSRTVRFRNMCTTVSSAYGGSLACTFVVITRR